MRPTKTFWDHHYWNQVVQISDQGRILALFWAPVTQRENDTLANRPKFKESKVT